MRFLDFFIENLSDTLGEGGGGEVREVQLHSPFWQRGCSFMLVMDSNLGRPENISISYKQVRMVFHAHAYLPVAHLTSDSQNQKLMPYSN